VSYVSGIVATIRQHNRLRAQPGQKQRTEAIVMSLAGGKAEPHGQAVGVNHGVDFAGQSASRAAHVLLTIFCNACSMLVHAYNGRIDHLHGRIVSRRQAIHDPIQENDQTQSDPGALPII
jgi:hypothetical protein